MDVNTLPKTYESKDVEAKWYEFWLKNHYFHAQDASDRKPFCIVIPPPNVTGMLHMGHALNNTLQDIMTRYRRMQGYNALWMPGTDHAGIATQNVVEQELAREGKTRHDLGREKFIERVWTWKVKYGGVILNQLQRLGCSCDWERERFTMDEGLSRAVREVFVRLWHDGLIYKGDYIVNWCPRCHTAISDLEVEFEQEKSNLWHIRYPYADGTGEISVATTRPETMLGDTAVAVNPNDPRYKDVIGKMVILPLVNKEIPVIADDYVTMDFGSGAVKITPSCDAADFAMAERHNLEIIKIMDGSAVINENGGVLGRPVEAIVEDGDSDWPTFAAKAEKLIAQDKVCTIFGCWTSASRKTVMPIVEKHDHLLFYPLQYEGLEQSPNIIYTGAAPNQQIIPAVKWAVSVAHKKRFFLVGSDYVFPRCANAIIRDAAKGLNVEVVGEEYLLLGSSEPSMRRAWRTVSAKFCRKASPTWWP